MPLTPEFWVTVPVFLIIQRPLTSFPVMLAPSLELSFLQHPLHRAGKELMGLQQREHPLNYTSQDVLLILLRKLMSTRHPILHEGPA